MATNQPTQEVTRMSQPGNPFVVPGMPDELAEIICIHRGLFGGFTMTAAAPEAQQQAQDGQAAAQGSGQQQAGTDSQAAGQQGAQGQQQTQESDADKIARLERELTAARGEAGKERVNAKQAAADAARNQLVQELGRALGLVKDDTPSDPRELQTQIASVGTENAALKAQVQAQDTRLAALLAAVAQGVNPGALLDSNSFLKAIDGLAPTDADKIKTAIDAAIQTNSAIKAQVAGRSGNELGGGTGEGATTKAQFDAMNIAQRTALFNTNPTLYRQLAG